MMLKIEIYLCIEACSKLRHTIPLRIYDQLIPKHVVLGRIYEPFNIFEIKEQVSGGKTVICLSKLRKLFNCDNAYIDTLCEDAYQIRNGKKPSPEFVELGDSEETKRLYFETVSKKADPYEIPLEKWLEENGIGEVRCSEENGDFFEEYNIHAEEDSMDEENYWRTNDFLKEQDEIVLSKHVSEKEEITEIVATTLYGKVNVGTFLKIMNILKEEL